MAEKDWLKKMLKDRARARSSRSPYLPPVEGPKPKPVYGPPQKPPPWNWQPPRPPKIPQPPRREPRPPRSPYLPPVEGPRQRPTYGPEPSPPPWNWQPPRPPQIPQQRAPEERRPYQSVPSGQEASGRWQATRRAPGLARMMPPEPPEIKPPSEQYDLTKPIIPQLEPAKTGREAARDWYKVYGKAPVDAGEEPPPWSPLGQARKGFEEGVQTTERGALPELPSVSRETMMRAAPLAATPIGALGLGAIGGYSLLQKGSKLLQQRLPNLSLPERFGLGLFKGSQSAGNVLTELQSAYQTMGLASDPSQAAALGAMSAMGEAGPIDLAMTAQIIPEDVKPFVQEPEQQEAYQRAISDPTPENVYKFWETQPQGVKTTMEMVSLGQQLMLPGPEVAVEHLPDVVRLTTAMMSDPAAYNEITAATRMGQKIGSAAEKTGVLAHTKTSIAEKAAQWSSWYASRALESRIVEDVATGQKTITPSRIDDMVRELKEVEKGIESPEVREVFSHFDPDNLPIYQRAMKAQERMQSAHAKRIESEYLQVERNAARAAKRAESAKGKLEDASKSLSRHQERLRIYEKEVGDIERQIAEAKKESRVTSLQRRLEKKKVQIKSTQDRIEKAQERVRNLNKTIKEAEEAAKDVESAGKIRETALAKPPEAEVDLGAFVSQMNGEILRASYERAGIIPKGGTLADAKINPIDKLNQYRKTVSTFFWLSSPRYVIRNVVNNYITGYASGLNAFSKEARMWDLANEMFGLEDVAEVARGVAPMTQYAGLKAGRFSRWMEYTPLGWGRMFARKATESERFYGEVGARRRLLSDAAMRAHRSLWSGDSTGPALYGIDSMFPTVDWVMEDGAQLEPRVAGMLQDALRTAKSWPDAEAKTRKILSGEYTPILSHLPEDTSLSLTDIDNLERLFNEEGVAGLRKAIAAMQDEAENASMIDLRPINPDDYDFTNRPFAETISRIVKKPAPAVDDELIQFTNIYEDFWKGLAEYADRPGAHKVVSWVANKVMREKLLTYRRADELMAKYRRLAKQFGSAAWDTYYEMELPALWEAENARHVQLTEELLGKIEAWISGAEVPPMPKERYADDLVREYTEFWRNLDMPRDEDFQKFEQQLMANRTERMQAQLEAWGDVQKALGEGNHKVIGHFNAAEAEAERILGVAAAYVRRNRMDWLAKGGKKYLREQMSLVWAKATRDVRNIYSDFRLSAAFDDVPDFAKRASKSEIEKLVRGTEFEDVLLDNFIDLGIGTETNDKVKAANEFVDWANEYVRKHNDEIRKEVLAAREAERIRAIEDAGYDTVSLGKISPELVPRNFPRYDIDPALRGETGVMRMGYADPGKKEYVVQYEVIPESKLVTSHDYQSFRENPDYDQALQERLRDAPVQKWLVDRMAQNLNVKEFTDPTRHLTIGPVVIGPNNEVLGGNGRIMALRRAMEFLPDQGVDQDLYIQILRDAKMFGIDPKEVRAMREAGETPVLVRRLVEKVPDLPEFAADLNVTPVSTMDEAAYVEKLANLIDDEMIGKLARRIDTKTLYGMVQRSKDFVADMLAKLPPQEVGKFTEKGGALTKQGLDKIRAAIIARAYNSPWLIENYGIIPEERQLFKGIGRGMELAAPEMLRLSESVRVGETLPQYNLSDYIAEGLKALTEYRNAKTAGTETGTLTEYLTRASLFDEGRPPIVVKMAEFLDRSKQNPERVRQMIVNYADMVRSAKTGQLPLDVDEVMASQLAPEAFLDAAIQGVDLGDLGRVQAEGGPLSEYIEAAKAARRKSREEEMQGTLFGDVTERAREEGLKEAEAAAQAKPTELVEEGGVEETVLPENLRADPYTLEEISDQMVLSAGRKFVKPIDEISDLDDDQIEVIVKAFNEAKPDSMPEITVEQLRMARNVADEGQWAPVRVTPNKWRDMLYQSGMQPHEMPDAQGPTVGAYTREWANRAIQDIEGLIAKAEAGELTPPPVPPEDVDRWMEYVRGNFQEPYIESKSMVAPIAKRLVDYALLDYGDRRYIDSAMELVFPYWFWPSRTAKNWMQRLIHHPGWLTAYSDLMYHIEQQADDDISIPHRYAGKIPVPFTDKQWWIGGVPEMLMPFANILPDFDYNHPADAWGQVFNPDDEARKTSTANRTLQAIITTMNALGLGTYPGLDFAANEIMGKPTKGVRDVIPAIDVMASGSALLRNAIPELSKIIPPGGYGFTPVGSQWALYWTRRMVANKAAEMLGVSDQRLKTVEEVNQFLMERGIDSQEKILPYRRLVEDLGRWERGEIEDWELKMIVKGEETPEFLQLPDWQQEAMRQEHEVYAEAAQAAGTDRALSVLSGFFLALRANNLRPSEQQVQAEKAAKAETQSRAEYKDFLNKAPEQVVGMNPKYDIYTSIGRRYDLEGVDTKYREQMDSLIRKEPGNFWKQADLRNQWYNERRKVFEKWEQDQRLASEKPELWSTYKATPEEVLAIRREQILDEIAKTRPRLYKYYENPEGATKDERGKLDFEKYMADMDAWYASIPQQIDENETIQRAIEDAMNQGAMRDPLTARAWLESINDPAQIKQFIEQNELRITPLDALATVLKEQHYGRKEEREKAYVDEFGPDILKKKEEYDKAIEHLMENEWGITWENVTDYYDAIRHVWNDDIWEKQNRYYDEIKRTYGDDIWDKQDQYFSYPKGGSARRQYLKQHPELLAYWKGKDAIMRKPEYAGLEEYKKLSRYFAKYYGVEEYLKWNKWLKDYYGVTEFKRRKREIDKQFPGVVGGSAEDYINAVYERFPWMRNVADEETLRKIYADVAAIPDSERIWQIKEAYDRDITLDELDAEQEIKDMIADMNLEKAKEEAGEEAGSGRGGRSGYRRYGRYSRYHRRYYPHRYYRRYGYRRYGYGGGGGSDRVTYRPRIPGFVPGGNKQRERVYVR